MLAGIDGLVTAKEWERAAIVAAFVVPGSGWGGQTSTSGGLSQTAFAALGIAGLRSASTVGRYVEAWESTGLGRPTPGEEFEATNLGDFPRTSKSDDPTPGAQKVKDISNNTRSMAEAIVQSPKVAEAAREALLQIEMARVTDQTRVDRVKNDPTHKAMVARHAEGKEVLRAIAMAADAVRTLGWLGANWGDLWEKATDFERGTLVEILVQAQAEIGVLQMYAATQDAQS